MVKLGGKRYNGVLGGCLFLRELISGVSFLQEKKRRKPRNPEENSRHKEMK